MFQRHIGLEVLARAVTNLANATTATPSAASTRGALSTTVPDSVAAKMREAQTADEHQPGLAGAGRAG